MTLPAIIQSYIDAYNRKDAAALVACVGDDVVFENVSSAGQSMKIEGRTAFAELAEQAATMFTTAIKPSPTQLLMAIMSQWKWIGPALRLSILAL